MSWPENRPALFDGGQRFAIRLPANVRLRMVVSTPVRRTPFFFKTPTLLGVAASPIPESGDLDPREFAEPQGLEGTLTPLPLRARRDSERVGAVLEQFLANPARSIPPPVLSAGLEVSLRTLENACVAVAGHPPAVLQRVVRLNTVRLLLENGAGKTVCRMADSVGLRHHGRFSADYRNLFGEPPSRTRSRAV